MTEVVAFLVGLINFALNFTVFLVSYNKLATPLFA